MKIKLIGLLVLLVGCGNTRPDNHDNFGAPIASGESCEVPPRPTSGGATWVVHFSPKGGCTDFLVQAINKAQKSVFVQAYSFTSLPIAQALVAKRQQNRLVEVIVDKGDIKGKGSMIKFLVDGGVPVYIDDKHAIAHNKVIVIDDETVFTGSFNFTKAAEESNAENSIELTDPKLAEVYQNNWYTHKQHSSIFGD
jgi:phosphatidylserine/phosphatidylglycerophosphate/cardiolipin synthase-like enzyme